MVLNRAQRSADIQVAGAAGAGANLVREAEETICRAYALNSVKISCVQPAQPKAQEPVRSAPVSEPQGEPKPKAEPKPEQGDPFARTEAIRRAAMERSSVRPAAHAERKAKGEAIFGRAVTKRPTPMNELELDMGVVVVEGDVFAVDHKELKKRGAWVVAFDLTDYTGSIRVNKFFPGDEGKPIVDGVKKGMHLKVQGRLNMDRFYGDMVLEPMAITTAPQELRQDTAPEKRVELHLHTNMSAMDALTAVGFKTDSVIGSDKNVVKRAERWGHPAIAITDHGVAHAFPNAKHSAKNIKILFGVEAYYLNDVDDRVVVHGQPDQPFDDEIVCFDIETTGLDRRREVIIEIGAVVLKNGEVGERFNTFVSPGRILNPDIIRSPASPTRCWRAPPARRRPCGPFWTLWGTGPWPPTTRTSTWALSPPGAGNTASPLRTPPSTA